jgi:hypothetical protein
MAGTRPFGFDLGERDHRTLDREQFNFAIAARPQRPTGMRGQRCGQQRAADAAESVAVGIRRLYQHRIRRALGRRLDRIVTQPQLASRQLKAHECA